MASPYGVPRGSSVAPEVRSPPEFTTAFASARRGSRTWLRLRAGILVLDVADRRLRSTRAKAATIDRYVTLRRAVDAVAPTGLREALDGVIECLVRHAPIKAILMSLATYAERLNRGGWFMLGAAVYRLIIERATNSGLVDCLPRWYEDLGFSLREAGDGERAEAAYRRGLEIADGMGDDVAAVRLRIARANRYRISDRLGDAQTLAEDALQRAHALGRYDLMARAYHEAGVIAHAMQKPRDALALYAQALRAYGYSDGEYRNGRDRLLVDIARALAAVRLRAIARAACGVIYLTARERYTRWVAAINMLDIAADEELEWLFDQYRLALARSPMPGRLLAFYHFNVGCGCQRFGRHEAARTSLETAARMAIRLGLSSLGSQAKAALACATLPAPDPAAQLEEFPQEIRDLALTVSELARSPRRRVDSPQRRADVEPTARGRRTLLRPGRSRRSDRD